MLRKLLSTTKASNKLSINQILQLRARHTLTCTRVIFHFTTTIRLMNLPCLLLLFYMVRSARKGPLSNLRTTQALISLRISAGWSGPAMFAYRISGYCNIYRRTEDAQTRLQRCARWSGPILTANCIRITLCLAHHIPYVNSSFAEHDMPCLSKQCRSRSVGFWDQFLSINLSLG